MTTRIDAIEARALMNGGVRFIDVLPASVFTDEHLPAAVNVPLEAFQPSALDAYARDAPLIVYCFDQH